MIGIYRILFIPAVLLATPYYALRMIKRGGYGKDFSHRFGAQKKLPNLHKGEKRVWIQAVSVGEVEALAPLLKKLSSDEKIKAVVTTTTSTGYKILREKYSHMCEYVGIFPLDFFPFSARAWNKINPDLAIMMEGELWPEHLHQARVRGIPSMLINARLSDKSFSRYAKIPRIAKRLFSRFSKILTSSEQDLDRIKKFTQKNSEIYCVGNLKFDSQPDALLSAEEKNKLKTEMGFEENSFVLLGSSTWPGEEEMLIETLEKIRSSGLDARLLIVPRHAERRGEIEEILKKSKLPYSIRSRQKSGEKTFEQNGENIIYLADTTGELKILSQLADCAFVGKSLPPNSGGQTPIDCAQLKIPMVYGPNMTNFRIPCKSLENENAAIKVESKNVAIEALFELSQDSSARKALSEAAKKWHSKNAGASQKTFEAIKDILF